MNQTVPQLKTNPSDQQSDYRIDAEHDNENHQTNDGNGKIFVVFLIHNNKP